MGVVLPSEVAWILDLIGIEWPNIDEDEIRSAGQELRQLASELTGHTGDAKSEVESLLNANSSQSLELFEALWNKVAKGHLPQLAQGLEALATGLDLAAVVVVGLKVAAIVQLVALAAEVIADQAAAVVTFGASEALAAAQVVATRAIVKTLVKQAVSAVEQQMMQVVEGPIFAALEGAAGEMAGQLLGNAVGVSSGVDLGKAAKAGVSAGEHAV